MLGSDPLELLHHVVRRRLAFDGRIEREQHFLDLAGGHPGEQARDVEPVRPDAVERRQMAAEDVIARVDDAGPLQRPQVADLLDDDDQRGIARSGPGRWYRASRCRYCRRWGTRQLLRRDVQRLRQRHQQVLTPFQQRQRRLAAGARTKARQARQQLDQPLDLGASSLPAIARHLVPAAQNSFRPGGSGRPPVIACIFSASVASTLTLASCTAAMIRSSRISTSSASAATDRS